MSTEFESWIGSDDDVLRTLSADGRTAISAYRDPDTRTATIAHDDAILGRLELSGGYFDGPSDSVDTTHPIVRSLTAAGFNASHDCEPTSEADTQEPEGCLILAIRVLTGITLNAANFEGPWTGSLSRTALSPGLCHPGRSGHCGMLLTRLARSSARRLRARTRVVSAAPVGGRVKVPSCAHGNVPSGLNMLGLSG
ncbi:hypothetical protein [Streptomyces sp. NPDC101150]|uniref:hypothetical protein n=1 Tax=Streptomyces sp. NPDC101150 TaxID=3366114 RepID=UPI00382092BB